MNIREARPEENDKLIALQMTCPQGKTLIASVVNTPDFFARAKAYESSIVFVADDGKHIIGSVAFTIKNAVISGKMSRVGYGFQAFVAPAHRRRGLMYRLLRHCEEYAILRGVELIYGLIIEDNIPSIRWFESGGYRLHRKLVMPGIPVYKELEIRCNGSIRQAEPEDLPAIAQLLNETWRGFEMYEPTSADGLSQFVRRTPGYDLNNLFVLEDGSDILACLGYWDWRKIMRIKVEALSLKVRFIGLLVGAAGLFKPMPRPIKPGSLLKQIVLTPIGFKDPAHLSALLRHVNNQALQMGIEQIFCICERGHVMLKSMNGFIRINTTNNLYLKKIRGSGISPDKPVFIDGIDL